MLLIALPPDALTDIFSCLFVDSLALLQATCRTLAHAVPHAATSAWSDILLFTVARLRGLLDRHGHSMETVIRSRHTGDWLAAEYAAVTRLLARADAEITRRTDVHVRVGGFVLWLSAMVRQRRLALATAARVCLLGRHEEDAPNLVPVCEHLSNLGRAARGADPVVSNIAKFLDAGRQTPYLLSSQTFNQRLRLARRTVVAAAVGDVGDLSVVLRPPLGADPGASLSFEGLNATALGHACRYTLKN